MHEPVHHAIRRSGSRHGAAARLARFAAILLGFIATPPAPAQTRTQWKSSPVRISSLHSIVHGGGLFVALNATGRILVSGDGLTWTERAPVAGHRLHEVIHAGGLFLGVGDSGTLVTSADAAVWTRRNPGTFADLRSASHRKGQFLVVGDKGTLLVSKDGAAWTRRESNPAGPLTAVAHGDPGYVIFAADGTGLVSPDGIAWTSGPSPVAAKAVIYAGKQFLAVGKGGAIHYSPDGKTWAKAAVPVTVSLHAVIRGPDRYLAVGDSGIALVSRDGRVWTRHAIGPDRHGLAAASLFSVAYGKGRYVAVGANEALWISRDGETWSSLHFHPGSTRSVAFGAGRYVSVGANSEVGLSADGILWTQWDFGIPGRMPRNGNPERFHMNSIIFARGRFLAVGERGGILVSPDGEKWTVSLPDTLAYHLLNVAHGPGGYVAVGSGRPAVSNGEPYRSAGGVIVTSLDGRAWTLRRDPDYDDLHGVAYGNGRYVAAGEDGRILTSPDGRAWTRRKSGSEQRLFSVAYGAGRFVVVGWGGTLLTSSDGAEWTDRSVAVERFLDHILFNGRQFVTVGSGSALATSADGIHWKLGGTGLLYGLPSGLARGRSGHVILGGWGKAGYTTDSEIQVDTSTSRRADPKLVVSLEGRERIRIGIPAGFRSPRIPVTLSDVYGRRLLETRMFGLDDQALLPIGDLSPGTYRVEIESGPLRRAGEFYLSPGGNRRVAP